jgi:hypothetical protein
MRCLVSPTKLLFFSRWNHRRCFVSWCLCFLYDFSSQGKYSVSLFFCVCVCAHINNNSNNVDVVVFSLFENQYNQCMDEAVGTYYIPVPTFVQGFTSQKEQDMSDQGDNDYEIPDVAQYIYCTPFVISGQTKYLQIGCADDTVLSLAINIYNDKDCTTRSGEGGYDDATIDVTEIYVRCYTRFPRCLPHTKRFPRCWSIFDGAASLQEMQSLRELVRPRRWRGSGRHVLRKQEKDGAAVPNRLDQQARMWPQVSAPGRGKDYRCGMDPIR